MNLFRLDGRPAGVPPLLVHGRFEHLEEKHPVVAEENRSLMEDETAIEMERSHHEEFQMERSAM